MSGAKCYKFQRVDAYDGGIGAFATRDIKKGELILREGPIVTARLETLESVEGRLSDKQRKQLFSLCDWRASAAGTRKSALGIFQANGYPAPAGPRSEEAGVFLAFSRFNHGCVPNVSHSWHGFKEKVVFASRDIIAGEELLTNYVELCCGGQERREVLRERFGFECTCVACARDDEAESDARRRDCGALDETIYQCTRRGKYDDAVRDAEKRLELLEAEGLDSPAQVVRTCNDAYQAMDHAGRPKDAKAWLERVLASSLLCEPGDSPELSDLRSKIAKLASK